MAMETATADPAADYPVRFDVEYPESLSRWLIFVKWILAIPHMIILYILGIIAYICTFIAFFAILFTEKYPRGLFDFVVNVHRWNANAGAYYGLLRDEYPPFSWESGEYPPVTFQVDYPERLNRFLPFIKWLLVIPHYIALIVLWIIGTIIWFIAFFAILFTGSFPRGMFDFIVGMSRWSYRVNAYVYLLTDQYPPFSMK